MPVSDIAAAAATLGDCNSSTGEVMLLRFTGPPAPITARMHSTPQLVDGRGRFLLRDCDWSTGEAYSSRTSREGDQWVLSASLPLLAQEDP
eukprot:9269949-Pyramimonas_sp.AAC.1